MWKCPRCLAMNYQKGPCECCGYEGDGDPTSFPIVTWGPYIVEDATSTGTYKFHVCGGEWK